MAHSGNDPNQDYSQLSQDELAELARQGDPDAGAEIIARAQAASGWQAPPGSEELGPDVWPEWQGPELPPYQSGRTPLAPGDIDRLASFNTRARRGDDLEGHEVLQHAFLAATGQATRRNVGVSRDNPSLSVDPELHDAIDAEQRNLQLHDPDYLAGLSDKDVIDLNCDALARAGVERSQIEMIRREATDYADSLRAAAPQPAPPETPPDVAASSM